MKLWYDKKSKDPTYFIQVGIRNGKKVTSKNIAKIGKHSELLKVTDDPLAYAKEEVAKYNEEGKKNYEEPVFDYQHIMRTMDLMYEHYNEYIEHLLYRFKNINCIRGSIGSRIR